MTRNESTGARRDALRRCRGSRAAANALLTDLLALPRDRRRPDGPFDLRFRRWEPVSTDRERPARTGFVGVQVPPPTRLTNLTRSSLSGWTAAGPTWRQPRHDAHPVMSARLHEPNDVLLASRRRRRPGAWGTGGVAGRP